MDAVDLLVRQHREIEHRMKRVLENEDADARCKGFAEVADELAVHIASEEEVFYPAVKAKRTEDILLESLEEHLSLKRVLADLLELDPDDKRFEAKLHVLKEQAEHHHEEEEENLFPKVKKLLDGEHRRTLGEEMMALQEKMQKRGEPRERISDQTEAAAPLK